MRDFSIVSAGLVLNRILDLAIFDVDVGYECLTVTSALPACVTKLPGPFTPMLCCKGTEDDVCGLVIFQARGIA